MKLFKVCDIIDFIKKICDNIIPQFSFLFLIVSTKNLLSIIFKSYFYLKKP